MAIADFDKKLNDYADVVTLVGLNIQKGQDVLIRAHLESAEFTRKVAAAAYRAGARRVDVVWDDEVLTLVRLQNAAPDTFDSFPVKMAEWLTDHVQSGGAILSIRALNPDLLSNENPDHVMAIQRAAMTHFKAYSEVISHHGTNWCVISTPAAGWAGKVFPNMPVEQSIERLWGAIFELARINHPDPVAHWKEHSARLEAMARAMTDRQYTALRYTGPGTDLTIGLVAGHQWLGGGTETPTGIHFVANVPTEEIFTMPHKDRIDGVVKATMPLNYQGVLVDDFSVTFKGGRVVDVQAGVGGETLRKLIETDEGAASLGEVALVPFSSPISKSGTLFYNTLFDENAACHVALGRAYANTLQDGGGMSQEKLAAAGCNFSLIHVDFMIGSNQIDIDGITADGRAEPVMRKGEWAFES